RSSRRLIKSRYICCTAGSAMTMMLLVLTSAVTVALRVRMAPADLAAEVSSAPATVERAPYLMSEVLPVLMDSRSLRVRTLAGLLSTASADDCGLGIGRSERGAWGLVERSTPVLRGRGWPWIDSVGSSS